MAPTPGADATETIPFASKRTEREHIVDVHDAADAGSHAKGTPAYGAEAALLRAAACGEVRVEEPSTTDPQRMAQLVEAYADLHARHG